jgi:hypothetical protein
MTPSDRSDRERVGVWLCCVVYLHADGTNSTGGVDDDPDGGCPNCGGHGGYRSIEPSNAKAYIQ